MLLCRMMLGWSSYGERIQILGLNLGLESSNYENLGDEMGGIHSSKWITVLE
jgi:hypothetical protein